MLQATRESDSERPKASPAIASFTHRLHSKTAATSVRHKTLAKKQPAPLLPPSAGEKNCQTRRPVITGEAHYKGMLAVDGILIGQIGAHGAGLSVRQKARSVFASQPELAGEINFEEMVRVNGHSICTMIEDSQAVE